MLKDYASHRPLPWGFLACGVIYWCVIQFISLYSMAPPVNENPFANIFTNPGMLNLIGSILGLLLAIVSEARGETNLTNLLWVMFGTFAILVGITLNMLFEMGLLYDRILASDVFIGLGAGLMLIELSDAFSCFELPQALFYVALEILASAPLSLFLLFAVPDAVALGCLLVLVALQAGLFVKNRRAVAPVPQRVPAVAWNRNKHRAVVVFLAVAFCGLCVGFVLEAMPKDDPAFPAANFAALVVAGLILGFISTQLLNQWAEELMLKVCMPLLTAGLLCLSLLDVPPVVPLFLCASCTFCLTGLIWFFASEYHAESQVGLHWITAIMFAMTFVGHLIGSALGFVAATNEDMAGVLTAIFLFAIVMFLLTILLGHQKRVGEAMRLLGEHQREMVHAAIADEHGLTSREKEILGFLADGVTSKQIAEQLFISENTVNTHIHGIFKKMNVHSRVELNEYLEQQSGPLRAYSDDPVPYVDK